MAVDRLWHIETDEFARIVESIPVAVQFDFDETVNTWQCSYFRFVRAPLTAFESLVQTHRV